MCSPRSPRTPLPPSSSTVREPPIPAWSSGRPNCSPSQRSALHWTDYRLRSNWLRRGRSCFHPKRCAHAWSSVWSCCQPAHATSRLANGHCATHSTGATGCSTPTSSGSSPGSVSSQAASRSRSAEAVCATGLDTLRRSSTTASSAPGGERFAMLETIREYASREARRKRRRGRVAPQRTRAHYLAFVEAAAPELTGPDQAAWLRRLESDHDNLRAALRYSLEEGPDETALRLASALWPFWLARGYLGEGRRWLEESLAMDGDAAATASEQGALHGAGLLAHYQGDYARAEELCRESLELSRAGWRRARRGERPQRPRPRGTDDGGVRDGPGDVRTGARDLQTARRPAGHRADPQPSRARGLVRRRLRAVRHCSSRKAWPGFESSRTSRVIGLCLLHRGMVALSRGDPAGARPHLEECLAICRELGDRRTIAKATYFLGDAFAGERDHAAARTLYEESLSLSVELGDRWVSAISLEGPRQNGDSDRAARGGRAPARRRRRRARRNRRDAIGVLSCRSTSATSPRRVPRSATPYSREPGRPDAR